MNFSNIRLRTRIYASFGAVLLVMIVIIGAAMMSASRQTDAEGWSKHTSEVLDEGNAMLLAMVNAETGMRGFVAAGEDRFLEPFIGGKKSFGEHIAKAKSLTSDNAKQQERLAAMQQRHEQFMKVADSLIELRRAVTAEKSACRSSS